MGLLHLVSPVARKRPSGNLLGGEEQRAYMI